MLCDISGGLRSLFAHNSASLQHSRHSWTHITGHDSVSSASYFFGPLHVRIMLKHLAGAPRRGVHKQTSITKEKERTNNDKISQVNIKMVREVYNSPSFSPISCSSICSHRLSRWGTPPVPLGTSAKLVSSGQLTSYVFSVRLLTALSRVQKLTGLTFKNLTEVPILAIKSRPRDLCLCPCGIWKVLCFNLDRILLLV